MAPIFTLSPHLILVGQIDTSPILRVFGWAIYTALAVAAGYGVYCVVMLMRRVAQKSFPTRESANSFLDDIGNHLEANNFDGAMEHCDSPELWARAVPQLVAVAVQNRNRPIRKIRQMLNEFFEREIIADFDARMAWLNTIVKAAPMLGLLGTVIGMIGAFETIAGSGESGVQPSALAADIQVALRTTAFGLVIAIPIMILSNLVNSRISKLQDSVDEEMSLVLDDLEAAQMRAGLQK